MRSVHLALLLLALTPAAVAQPVALGDEFVVNTFTAADQETPAVGADAQGNLVVVWSSTSFDRNTPTQDGSAGGIYGRRLDAAGQPLGEEIQIHQTTAGNQWLPALAVAADGSFVVAWSSESGAPPHPAQIVLRRFDASGAALGPEIPVATDPVPRGFSPSVALGPAGEIAVAWESYAGVAYPAVWARLFAADGSPATEPFRVDLPPRGDFDDDERPTLAFDQEGRLLVAWEAFNAGLAARRFDPSGAPLGSMLLLNEPDKTGRVLFPVVAKLPGEGFVAAWSDSFTFARRYDEDGVPRGPQVRVDVPGRRGLSFPGLAIDAEGLATVAWSTERLDGDGYGVFAHSFGPSGVPLGPSFRLNQETRGSQVAARVAAGPDRIFTAVWSGTEHGRSTRDIFARRFRIQPVGIDPCLFAFGRLSCDLFHDGGEGELAFDPGGEAGATALLGEVGGDRRQDLCLYTAGTWRCDPDHDGVLTELPTRFGTAQDVPLLGDLNGDGKVDRCVRHRRRFACDTAGNGGTAEVQIAFGRLSDVPLVGDLDGDGDADPCVARGATLLCDLAHDGGAAELSLALDFAPAGSIPLLADADGDGDADPCLYSGAAFVCRTPSALLAIPFGGPGVALLGNLDGI